MDFRTKNIKSLVYKYLQYKKISTQVLKKITNLEYLNGSFWKNKMEKPPMVNITKKRERERNLQKIVSEILSAISAIYDAGGVQGRK